MLNFFVFQESLKKIYHWVSEEKKQVRFGTWEAKEVSLLFRDPYSFFLKVISRASIPKNMLALAKFWLPFQKWRIISKKRRQNGYMLKCMARAKQLG